MVSRRPPDCAPAGDGEPRNLSAYFLRGTSAAGPVPLTLAEALAKGVVTVHETGKVNQLDVENRGDEDVFIQAGDIVKGGQQDRVLTVSLLLSAGMGRMPIGAFCVEQGRWSERGSEDAKRFASADKAVPSREAKLAMMAPGKPMQSEAAAGSGASHSQPLRQQARGLGQSEMAARQSEVWATVGKIQEKLTTNLKAKIASGQSASSLQLSLENDALATAKAEYVKALQGAADADDDIVGVVFAINGRISSARSILRTVCSGRCGRSSSTPAQPGDRRKDDPAWPSRRRWAWLRPSWRRPTPARRSRRCRLRGPRSTDDRRRPVGGRRDPAV
jgi:hypothetical protein